MSRTSTGRIWTNATLSIDAAALLRRQVGDHPVAVASGQVSNLQPGAPDPELASATIAFGQPDPKQVIELPNLIWVHLTSAGYTRYDNDDVRTALAARGGTLTNSSSVYNDPCAQHTLAMMLAGARQMPQAFREQQADHRWPSSAIRAGCYLLTGQTALIYGYGAIARRLVELLEPFYMRLTAVRRNVRGDENVATVSSAHGDDLLQWADHVINILPSSPSTDGYFTADRLARFKPGAIFYNIGRGTTVDQLALLHALKAGTIGAAHLDVTDPEPLPPHHPLWSLPNCHITPHTAGGHATEFTRLVAHFTANLKRFDASEPLLDRVFSQAIRRGKTSA